MLDADNNEIDLKQNFEEDEDIGLPFVPATEETLEEQNILDGTPDGYTLQDENGEEITDEIIDDDFSVYDDENN